MRRAVQLFHPLLALIASATDKELAKYVQYLKEENKILRSRIPGKQITQICRPRHLNGKLTCHEIAYDRVAHAASRIQL